MPAGVQGQVGWDFDRDLVEIMIAHGRGLETDHP